MFHFFAKFGRKPVAKQLLPLVSVASGFGYMAYHSYTHKIIRNLFAAQAPSGEREEISRELQDIVTRVYSDIKDAFNKPIGPDLKVATRERDPLTIKWFSSSTMEPLTVGMTELKTGVMIGLPHRYNYSRIEELPPSFFGIQKFKFFRSLMGEKNKPIEDKDCIDCDTTNILTVDRSSPEGQVYVDSLILSDNAKKFSVARELFFSDTYRPIFVGCLISFSMFLSILLSRGSVKSLKLVDAHLTQRLPFYILSGVAGFGNYAILVDATNQYYYREADKKAIEAGQPYREGAVEYYTKTIHRHKALRAIDPDLMMVYDKDGNYKENLFRKKYIVFTESLERASEETVNQKTSDNMP